MFTCIGREAFSEACVGMFSCHQRGPDNYQMPLIYLLGWVFQKRSPDLSSGCQYSTLIYLLDSATSQSTAPSRMTGCGQSVMETAAQHLRDQSGRSTSPSPLPTDLSSAVAATTSAQAMFLKAQRQRVSIM